MNIGMPPILAKARQLDFEDWLRGILSAGISGFFSALSGAIVLPALDSNDFNIFKLRYYIALLALGLTSGIVSISKVLSAKPLPDYKAVTSTFQTITPAPGAPPKVIETVTETHIEPMPPNGK